MARDQHAGNPRAGALASRVSLAALAAGLLLGCGQEEAVRHYKIPKPELLHAQSPAKRPPSGPPQEGAATEPTDRLLGAIVLRGDRTWCLKMVGPSHLVAQQVEAFRQLVESLTFAGPDGPPKWTLPSSWRENEGSGEQLAVLSVAVEGQKLEVSVVALGAGSSPSSISVLDNVNRWRSQMRLPPLSAEQLEGSMTVVRLSEGTAACVDLVGTFSGNSAGSSSWAKPPSGPDSELAASGPKQELRYEIPAGWSVQPPAMFSLLTLSCQDGDRSAKITVSRLKGDAGGLLPNLNRWYRQAGLPEITPGEVASRTQPLEIDGIAGTYVEALGAEGQGSSMGIAGWMGPQPTQTWFVKMTGHSPLVRHQRESFQSFLKTLGFHAP